MKKAGFYCEFFFFAQFYLKKYLSELDNAITKKEQRDPWN